MALTTAFIIRSASGCVAAANWPKAACNASGLSPSLAAQDYCNRRFDALPLGGVDLIVGGFNAFIREPQARNPLCSSAQSTAGP